MWNRGLRLTEKAAPIYDVPGGVERQKSMIMSVALCVKHERGVKRIPYSSG